MPTTMRAAMARRGGVAVVLAATLVLGCSKKLDDLAHEYTPAFNAERTTLKQIASKLPHPGTVQLTKAGKLDPAPTYGKRDAPGNLDILMAEQLTDPDAEPELDLLLSHSLEVAMNWTGPKASAKDGRDSGGDFERTLKAALATRYLAIVRIVKFNRPVVKGERWWGGDVEGEVLVVDMSSKQVVASGPFFAQPSQEGFDFKYKQGEDPNEVAAKMIHEGVWSVSRKEVKRILEQTIGGSFEFDEERHF